MTDTDIDILARTIFGEARGDGMTGMQAVANVVLNRCVAAKRYMQIHKRPHHPLFGDGTPASCCKMPEQFSCWNDDDPNLPIIQSATADSPVFADALQIAADAIGGVLDDITHGATYYYAKSLTAPPYWAKGEDPCACIGNQLFFNNID